MRNLRILFVTVAALAPINRVAARMIRIGIGIILMYSSSFSSKSGKVLAASQRIISEISVVGDRL